MTNLDPENLGSGKLEQAIPSQESLKLLDLQLEVWKTAVKTQMHFNDMSAKARQHGIALVVAIVGFSFFLLTRNDTVNYINLGAWVHPIHISVLISILPPIVLFAVMRLDLGVYHQMLRGAVKFGENFEKLVMTKEIMRTRQGMTELITLYSRYEKINEVELLARDLDNSHATGPRFGGNNEKTAGDKIKLIYIIAIAALCALPVLLFFLHPRL